MGDRLYSDEECFLRGTNGRFKLDNLVPVSGIVIGITGGGKADTLQDVQLEHQELAARIKHL